MHYAHPLPSMAGHINHSGILLFASGGSQISIGVVNQAPTLAMFVYSHLCTAVASDIAKYSQLQCDGGKMLF